ncbi:MAG: triple tyrosine motif-containing protein [Bacteroidota bacterium]
MTKKQVIRHLLFLIFLGLGDFTVAQSPNIGILPIRNYSKSNYKAGTQNWKISQDQRGVLYFANNEGLLSFNGVNWDCLPISNQTILRSVHIHPDGRIFVGGQGEFGYFQAEANGLLRYHSLKSDVPEADRSFADVWDIVIWKESVFFRSEKKIFQFENGQIKVYRTNDTFRFMALIDNELLVQEQFSELLRFDGQAFIPYLSHPALKTSLMAHLAHEQHGILLASTKNGFFSLKDRQLVPFRTPHDAFFAENSILCASVLPNQGIAIGSAVRGLLILDGQLRMRYVLDKERGLQNNNIRSLFLDQAGNLWMGLDNGIDYVSTNSPFTRIYPDGQQEGTGYAVRIFKDNIYFGTSYGLYVADWKSDYDPLVQQTFQLVPGTSGQVWGLDEVGGALLMGHHEGTFELDKLQARNVSTILGGWTYVPIDEQYMVGGHYEGLALFEKTAQGWQFLRKLEGLEESCRIMVMDEQQQLWISHPYRGIYKVNIKADKRTLDVRFYSAKDGLPSNLFNHVFSINQQPVFAAEKGLYRYNTGSDSFVLDTIFTQLLGPERRIKKLQQDAQGNIWYVVDEEIGVIRITDQGLKKRIEQQHFPELKEQLVGGFENIYPYNPSNIFFGAEKGFIHYDPSKPFPTDSLRLVLNDIWLTADKDSLLFGGIFNEEGQLRLQQTAEIPTLPSHQNGLRFSFAATNYRDPENIRYQSWLEGMEKDWSTESTKTERDFTNLGSGKYTFHVRARSLSGQQSVPLSYRFRIAPPWYASLLAITLYIMLFLGLIIAIILRQRSRFELEKAELQSAHQKKEAEHKQLVQQSEQQIVQLQNEKLEAEIRHKNQELASATMHLVQKGEILLKVQERLDKAVRNTKDPGRLREEIRKINSILNQDTAQNNDWEQFAYHFDQVHSDFLKRLRDNYPQLSPNDSKLCAYLRMNLSTKEIAPLMNISVRGVEASRYRLRKKLNLAGETNLVDFILQV